MNHTIFVFALLAALIFGCSGSQPESVQAKTSQATMKEPVYEIAVRKVKAGQLDAFKTARTNFISQLKKHDTAQIDREFESFFALPEPDDSEVFIGMTKWSSLEEAGAAAQTLLNLPEAGAFFSTLDFKAYVLVKPIEGPDFDLQTLAVSKGHVLEVGVRKVKEGMEEAFESSRHAFIELLENQPGTLASWEFEVVGGQNTDGLTVGMTVYESQDAFMQIVENILQDPITETYFATFVPQAAQVAWSTTNQ